MNGRVVNKIVFLALFTGFASSLVAQPVNDSLQPISSVVSKKFMGQVADKTDKYYERMIGKTEKTLAKLARWEEKIKTILEKASPETAQRLFGNGQLTFADVLTKYREGKQIADDQRARYDEYRDKLTSTINYLDEKRAMLDSNLWKPLANVRNKTAKLNDQIKNTEQVQQFIRERKKQLIDEAVKHIGKSKHLQKISRESYYYVETLRNYKEIFSDPKKAEETAMQLLQKIPAFDEFLRKNSMLASLFRMPGDLNDPANLQSLAGLQSRTQVNDLIQQQIASGGPNAQQQFQQNIQAAQSQLSQLKEKVLKAGGSSSDADPDSYREPDFKINNCRKKTFWQKWELNLNIQTNRRNGVLPVSSLIGLGAGYRPHDRLVVGLGVAGGIGWGRDIQHIRISYSGASGRLFSEYKIKGSFHAALGFEMTYRPMNEILMALPPSGGVGGGAGRIQKLGLVGISKVVSVKSKFFKKTRASLLWDFLSYRQLPKGQAVVFRIGYSFK